MEPTSWPQIAVMGAGAVGSYFGGMLARAGAPVTLIGRARDADAIAQAGLRIDSKGYQGAVAVSASTEPSAVRGARIVILAVKTVDTAAAVSAIAPHLMPEAVVVSLQNGVDNARRIGALVSNPVIPAVVYVAAEMAGPGRVKHNGRGDLVIGWPRGAAGGVDLERLAAMFERAGIPCRVSAAIETDLWTKLALNCAYNAVSALGRARYGRILALPAALSIVEQAAAEVAAVGRAEGIAVNEEELVAAARRLGAVVPEAISSTAQDIEHGKRTEIDDFNGYVAERGAALGVATPVNRTLHALVKLLEENAAGGRA